MGCGASKRAKDDVVPSIRHGDENFLQRENKSPQKENKAQSPVKSNKYQSPLKNSGTQDLFDSEYAIRGSNNGRNTTPFRDVLNLDEISHDQVDIDNFGEISPIQAANAKENIKTLPKNGSRHFNTFGQELINRFGEQQTPAPTRVKQVRVRRQKTSAFNWPDQGQVEIKTISYKVVYSHQIKGFRTVKSKDNYITSLLTWYKDEEEDLYVFNIRDTMSTNLRSGNNLESLTPEINFHVDIDGQFLGIVEIDKFVQNLLKVQNIEKIPLSKQKQLQKSILNNLRNEWNLMVQEWMYINKPEHQDKIIGKGQQYGRNCVLLNKINSKTDPEMRAKLKKKLFDSKTYYQILGSNKMLRDKFKKWELYKDSYPPKTSQAKGNQRLVPHRNLRLNFIFTDEDEVMISIAEPLSIQPLVSNYQNTKKVVFEVNRDIYIDVSFEAKLSIYQWPHVQELNNDDFLIAEMIKFQDSCNQALGDLITEISPIHKIPLNYRIKSLIQPPHKEDEYQDIPE